MHISRSNRPALLSAASSESGLFVAPMIRTGLPSVFSSESSYLSIVTEFKYHPCKLKVELRYVAPFPVARFLVFVLQHRFRQ